MSEKHCCFLVPGDLATRTGGTIYDRRIIDGLRARGWQVDASSLGDGYPAPGEAARALASQVFEALPDGALVVVDGLAFGALPDLVGSHAARLRLVALLHHPLALETGLDPLQQRKLFDGERRALRSARGVIVTSASTAATLDAFGVAASRVTVVEPGTDPAPLSAPAKGPGLSLLCVATITPRKGHRLLVEALAGLRDRRWMLHCAGSLSMDAPCASALRRSIEDHGLGGRIVLHGDLDAADLQPLYANADLFVLPTFYEGYGMALAEALARGLPVISTRVGAIPDTVPGDAGVLVPPGDALALRAALERMIDDPAWRAKVAAGARRARSSLPDWTLSAERFESALVDLRRVALAIDLPA